MDRGPTEGVGMVDVPTKDFPSIQAIHSQDDMVADLLQQAAEAGGVVEGQAGVVLEQGSFLIILEKKLSTTLLCFAEHFIWFK